MGIDMHARSMILLCRDVRCKYGSYHTGSETFLTLFINISNIYIYIINKQKKLHANVYITKHIIYIYKENFQSIYCIILWPVALICTYIHYVTNVYGRVYVFYVGHVDKSSLYETLFHCNILSKHHHIHEI